MIQQRTGPIAIKNDLRGRQFGNLTVIKVHGRDKWNKTMWICECSCGNTTIVSLSHIVSGHTTSCGCKKYRYTKTHGMARTRQYIIWAGMIQRCENTKAEGYKNYGGRGINVCERWHEFELFWDDMKDSYADGLTIERVNNDDGYYKENCIWASRKEQNRNRRGNHHIERNGERKILTDWASELNIDPRKVCRRLKAGWSTEDALTRPIQTKSINKKWLKSCLSQ